MSSQSIQYENESRSIFGNRIKLFSGCLVMVKSNLLIFLFNTQCHPPVTEAREVKKSNFICFINLLLVLLNEILAINWLLRKINKIRHSTSDLETAMHFYCRLQKHINCGPMSGFAFQYLCAKSLINHQ